MILTEANHDKLAARLDEIDARLKILKARANELQAEARIEYNHRIKDLESQRSQLGEQISTYRAASEGVSAELQQGIEAAFNEIEEAIHTTADKLS